MEHSREEPHRLAEGAEGMNPWPLVDARTAAGGELVEEGFLDVEIFGHRMLASHLHC